VKEAYLCQFGRGVRTQFYLVPVSDVPSGGDVKLRLLKAKNNQQKKIHWAQDYEL
jgi:uncharacterized protein YnzC (UPF0291/DUF896 family)